ncbi:glutamamyl carboxypeptidase [Trypanosoma rangeli]|uniref:Glutamamyl carboxypeptidase n=1 Tax=Trypanosoma rangeli TaxID=5698 RepID=A0A422NTA4_TRYRA|nr:glutamamyl carboxypeptidase [Trypanosoma rangeli]RNF08700.1 glutamamyl carboxypeptidase [Trypanosoma rangeli]|eukprot:RNF08700.1 glutamamyl carboxypeptidase [Trypanosoma rangeli]
MCTLVHNPDKTKTNLWATLLGEGSIIFFGNSDVVSVDGKKWGSDPLTLTERDGKLYGCGTSDMKGVIAVCMSLTPELLKMERAKLIDDALTYDEDVSCLSGKVLAQFLRDHNIKAGGCIIGEPISNQLVLARKGTRSY